MMTLSEIVAELQRCGFECEGGALENHAAFHELIGLAQMEERHGRWMPVGRGKYVGTHGSVGMEVTGRQIKIGPRIAWLPQRVAVCRLVTGFVPQDLKDSSSPGAGSVRGGRGEEP